MSQVMTVLGPIEPGALGTTITHEHLFIDLSCYLRPPQPNDDPGTFFEPVNIKNLHSLHRDPYGNRDNCILDDVELAVREAEIFKSLGGRTIVDVTLVDIGRNVQSLAEVSIRTGLNIIAGCGHYIRSAYPPGIAQMSEQQLTDELVREIRDGIDETGIRPGVIGEIGTGHPIDPLEHKMLRAAAQAQCETGLTISIHVHAPGRRGHEVLDTLISAGARPDKIILGHIDASLAHLDIDFPQAVDYIESLAARGCYIEFDLCGNSYYFMTKEASWWLPSDRERAKALAQLCRSGYGDQMLLSHDVGHKHYLREFGGWGYGHVLDGFRHHMMEAGLSPSVISDFLITNPARALQPIAKT